MLQKFFARLALPLAVVALNLWPVLASAAGASISLTASSSTVPSGGTVIIAVYMNGGGNAINAVEADLTYPASQLQYVGFSATGSAFEIGASSGGGGGTATLDRGTTGSVSGSGLVGTVTFRALASSGSASIGVAGSSSLVSAGNPIPYGSSGVTVHFGSVAHSGSSASSAPAAPAAPKDTTAPAISAIKVVDVTPFSATVTWTTNEPADSAVEFGVDTNYGLSTSSAAKVTAHTVALNSAFLTPETLLHYRIKTADAAGNVATSQDQTFQLPGVPITVVVRGANGKPQANASVTIDGATGSTDSQGKVTLPSSLGNKKITTTYNGVTVQKPITVARSARSLPPIQLDLSKQPMSGWMLTSIGLLVVVLVLLGIDAVLFGSHFLGRLTRLQFLPKLNPHPGMTPAMVAARRAGVPPHPPVADQSPPPTTTVGEPPVDPEKTVAELMGEAPPALAKDPPPKPIITSASTSLSAPATPSPSLPPTPGVTKIAISDEPAEPTAETVAQRLKKPTHRAVPKHHPAKKPTKARKSAKS